MKVLSLLLAAISLLATPALAKSSPKEQEYLVTTPCTVETDGDRIYFSRFRSKSKGRNDNSHAHYVLECKNQQWRPQKDCKFKRCIDEPVAHCATHNEIVYDMSQNDDFVVDLDPVDYHPQELDYGDPVGPDEDYVDN